MNNPRIVAGWRMPALLARACTLIYLPVDATYGFRIGREVDVFSHSPSNGGVKVAVIVITSCEMVTSIPDRDYVDGGFDWLYRSGLRHAEGALDGEELSRDGFDAWRQRVKIKSVWAVRFTIKRVAQLDSDGVATFSQGAPPTTIRQGKTVGRQLGMLD